LYITCNAAKATSVYILQNDHMGYCYKVTGTRLMQFYASDFMDAFRKMQITGQVSPYS
jgi:hypothetical protein